MFRLSSATASLIAAAVGSKPELRIGRFDVGFRISTRDLFLGSRIRHRTDRLTIPERATSKRETSITT